VHSNLLVLCWRLALVCTVGLSGCSAYRAASFGGRVASRTERIEAALLPLLRNDQEAALALAWREMSRILRWTVSSTAQTESLSSSSRMS